MINLFSLSESHKLEFFNRILLTMEVKMYFILYLQKLLFDYVYTILSNFILFQI